MVFNRILIFLMLSFYFFSCKNDSNVRQGMDQNGIIRSDLLDTFDIDLNQSILYWQGGSPAGNHNGSIKFKEGSLFCNKKSIIGASISVDMNSLKNLDIEDEKDRLDLENHLKDNDFFQVDSFPESGFEIRSVSLLEDSTFNAIVHGYLTIKNVTRPLQVKCKVDYSGDLILISVPEFEMDRTEYNIMYSSKKILASLKDGFINDAITLSMKITAKKVSKSS